jgi:hypothetical protein
MLSIGKLVAGQAKYYLDQAEARVDVVDSVAVEFAFQAAVVTLGLQTLLWTLALAVAS